MDLTMHRALILTCICMLAMPLLTASAQESTMRSTPASTELGLIVEDAFGRSINKRGVTLVDWEGYIANPAIKIRLTPPFGMSYPAKAVLTAKEPRLHFDLPSTTGADGPRKEVVWQERQMLP